MSIATQIASLLDRGLDRTKTGKKLLQELEEVRTELDAEAVVNRKDLVAALARARTAEDEDKELAAMIEERDAFFENAPKLPKLPSIFRDGTDVNTLALMNSRIGVRQGQHREHVADLKNKLKTTAPDWMKDAISSFVANLATLEKHTRALTQRVDEKTGYQAHGQEVVVKVLDFAEYRASMLGLPAGGWIGDASAKARRLLLEAIATPEELRSRLEAIRKSQPAQKATWRNV